MFKLIARRIHLANVVRESMISTKKNGMGDIGISLEKSAHAADLRVERFAVSPKRRRPTLIASSTDLRPQGLSAFYPT